MQAASPLKFKPASLGFEFVKENDLYRFFKINYNLEKSLSVLYYSWIMQAHVLEVF